MVRIKYVIRDRDDRYCLDGKYLAKFGGLTDKRKKILYLPTNVAQVVVDVWNKNRDELSGEYIIESDDRGR